MVLPDSFLRLWPGAYLPGRFRCVSASAVLPCFADPPFSWSPGYRLRSTRRVLPGWVSAGLCWPHTRRLTPTHPAPCTARTPEHISSLSLPSTPGFPSPPCKTENQGSRCPDPPRIPWMVRARCRNLSQWPEQLPFLFSLIFFLIFIYFVCARS